MEKYLALDIGGTWLKGALFDRGELERCNGDFKQAKVPSLVTEGGIERAIFAVAEILGAKPGKIAGIGISTAGIVDYSGSCVERAADHLSWLCDREWKSKLETYFSAPCAIINDADAALIAARKLELISPSGSTALLAVGTGLGCAVIKDSHRIRAGRVLPLPGSIRTPSGSFDQIASAVKLSNSGDLAAVFRSHVPELESYLKNLVGIIKSVCILYNLDSVLIAGGLVAAAAAGEFDLAGALNSGLNGDLPELKKLPSVTVSPLPLPLFGAALLAGGVAVQGKKLPSPIASVTEIPLLGDIELADFNATELAFCLNEAENEAAELFSSSLPKIAEAAEAVAKSFTAGGRLIYLGAGTSGRLAAVDAVELPCTYGIDESRAVALIAGGNDDASLTIESAGEEDASSVPELLLLNVNEHDTVVGISASGSAFYVTSGLNFARASGACTVMIQESDTSGIITDIHIALRSGSEIVAGSTRMKAGTATKKALNFLTTIAMIKLGKTRLSRMVNMRTLNEKLRLRADNIH